MKSIVTDIRLQFNESTPTRACACPLSIPTAGTGGRGRAERGISKGRS